MSEDERGVILVNVLLFVAIAAGVVMLMIRAEDGAIARSVRLREASRALAAAQGAELSAVTALRRDLATAPQTDSPDEAWAQVSERDAPIAGGKFDLLVADATGRFNLANLAGDDPAALLLGSRIATAAGLSPDQALATLRLVRAGRTPPLDPAVLARLAPLVTLLPLATPINLNAADEAMLAVLVGDPLKARRLVETRTRQGRLTLADFAAADALVPPGTGFTSSLYWSRARVRIGDTTQQLTSLIRRRSPNGTPDVAVIARWLGPAPLQAPAL